MVTFLSTIFVLVVVNIALLLFSGNRPKLGVNKFKKNLANSDYSKIYPLDLNTSKYKKAI